MGAFSYLPRDLFKVLTTRKFPAPTRQRVHSLDGLFHRCFDMDDRSDDPWLGSSNACSSVHHGRSNGLGSLGRSRPFGRYSFGVGRR